MEEKWRIAQKKEINFRPPADIRNPTPGVDFARFIFFLFGRVDATIANCPFEGASGAGTGARSNRLLASTP